MICLALLALAAGGVAVGAALSGGDGARGQARASSFSRDRYLGRVPPGARVWFGLTLQMRSAALNSYAAGVGTGSLPPLPAAQIGERFGVSSATLGRVFSRLRVAGVHVEEAFPQRTRIEVSAPAARVQQLLGVGLGNFEDAHGVRYHRPLGQPTIPLALRPQVLGATGLSTKRVPLAQAVPQTGMTASDLANLYDVRPLINQGLDGSGQTVAVFSEDTFQQSDISAFDTQHNISGAPAVERVNFGGGVQYMAGDGASEVDLDIEVIRELAPRAHILNYQGCCGADAFAPGIDKVVADGRAKLVNFSYGICELLVNSQPLLQADNSFAAAASAGVTVFVSSGDQGAYECQRNDRTDHRLSVAWPGSSPHVVSVGGTFVDVRQDGTRLDEVGWEDILSRSGGGGGVSAVFPRPSWQSGVPGVENRYTTSPARRQVPDVAADGSPASGYEVFTQGQDVPIGGTSASAPFWTGSFVLIDQLAKRQTGHLLPFIAPLLYRAAARDPNAFFDVTLGGNRFYRAGPGWDYSTGLGVPDMAVLASDVIAAARGR